MGALPSHQFYVSFELDKQTTGLKVAFVSSEMQWGF
jgi:hypothetical protein